LVVVEWRETDTSSLGPNGVSNRLDDLEGEAGTVLDGSTVCIGAVVYVVMEELVKEITVSARNC
jgi:hypothetical protein